MRRSSAALPALALLLTACGGGDDAPTATAGSSSASPSSSAAVDDPAGIANCAAAGESYAQFRSALVAADDDLIYDALVAWSAPDLQDATSEPGRRAQDRLEDLALQVDEMAVAVIDGVTAHPENLASSLNRAEAICDTLGVAWPGQAPPDPNSTAVPLAGSVCSLVDESSFWVPFEGQPTVEPEDVSDDDTPGLLSAEDCAFPLQDGHRVGIFAMTFADDASATSAITAFVEGNAADYEDVQIPGTTAYYLEQAESVELIVVDGAYALVVSMVDPLPGDENRSALLEIAGSIVEDLP